MSEASEHFEKAVIRAEVYDPGMTPELHIARGLHALAVQIERIEGALRQEGVPRPRE